MLTADPGQHLGCNHPTHAQRSLDENPARALHRGVDSSALGDVESTPLTAASAGTVAGDLRRGDGCCEQLDHCHGDGSRAGLVGPSAAGTIRVGADDVLPDGSRA